MRFALDYRYEAYALSIGEQIRSAAKVAFVVRNRPDNEWRTSETTPPKYLNSFHVRFYRARKLLRVYNDDPAWNLVEWGSHPGGNPANFVLRYKPLTRGFLAVAGRG